eukprot:TRINITY_DN11324_c0_g1_i1.p2 TRINITY_DN11324_c0_g1~~TRINITY_DN11324_c0_g1_i1.p2  ORF type:complete len:291 (-),score=92.91 TRINITY_DN11324_c0_g1_i1:48-920(-)
MLFYLGVVALVAVAWFFFFRAPAPNYDRKYKDKVVVITGASGGLGWELARQLSKFRPKLVVAARNEAKLAELKEICLKLGAKEVLTVPTDVSDRDACKNLVEKTRAKFGAIDVLFLNAGVSQASFASKTDNKVLDSIMKTNFYGAVDTALFALEDIRKAKGHIVVTSSVVQRLVLPGASAYCASKAAVSAFFDCLRTEEARNGVKVTVLCPGFVPTGVVENSLTGTGEKLGKTKSLPFRMELVPAVKLAIDSVASNKMEVWYTPLATAVMMFRGFAPNLMDRLQNRAIRQ